MILKTGTVLRYGYLTVLSLKQNFDDSAEGFLQPPNTKCYPNKCCPVPFCGILYDGYVWRRAQVLSTTATLRRTDG